ncbi:MAG: hypothetical protein M3159_06800 [Actinomycetota bacterium]|nr:hypothetical protein [Actinomycetota bacterium]
MADVLFVSVLVAFFALAALFVKGCDRMVGGPQTQAEDESADVDTDVEVAA